MLKWYYLTPDKRAFVHSESKKGLWTLSVHMLPVLKLKMSVLTCVVCDVYKSITISASWLTSHHINCHIWAVQYMHCYIPTNYLRRGRLCATRISCWTVGKSNHVSGSMKTWRDLHTINNLLCSHKTTADQLLKQQAEDKEKCVCVCVCVRVHCVWCWYDFDYTERDSLLY